MSPIYLEEQKFDQKSIRLTLLVILVGTTGLAIFIILSEKSYAGFIAFAFVLLIYFLFQKMKLKTKITGDSIYFSFFPLQINSICITKSEIIKIIISKYNPIADYGGWGVRIGRAGRAYTTSGDIGISITLKSGKNIMIGTRQPELVSKFLKVNGYPVNE